MAATTDADRLSLLEGAYEHLATKADLAEVKGEMKADLANLKVDMIKWMISTMFAAATLAAAVVIAVDRLTS